MGKRRIIILLCLAYAGINLARLGVQEARLLKQSWFMMREQATADAKSTTLRQQIADARSYRGAERQARLKLVLAKPGEIPVILREGAKPRIIWYPVAVEPAATGSVGGGTLH